ncbi:MAG: hypothetical protein KDG57_16235 [Rhodoferax sp.]|mgnify:CR=1 FL=1|nr:hypothetical protein [Rhodoferax sp.]
MGTPRSFLWLVLTTSATVFVAAYGGGSSEPGALPTASALTLAVLAGTPTFDFSACEAADGPAAQARFSRLSRVTVYQDELYLTESAEGCTNGVDDISGFVSDNLRPPFAGFHPMALCPRPTA